MIIESSSVVWPDSIVFDLALDMEVSGVEVVKVVKPTFNLGLGLSVVSVVDFTPELEFDLGLEADIEGFINNEPNVLLDEFVFDLGLDAECETQTSTEILAVFGLNLTQEIEVEHIEAEQAELLLTVDIFPESYGRSQRLRSRLMVDDIAVPLESFTFTEDANSLNVQLSGVLADINDRTKITPYVEITFDIGTWDGSDWVWQTLLDIGRANSTNHIFTRERDTFSFVGKPAEQAKLAQTPPENLVIYDSSRETLSVDDFEPIPDTGGNLHYTELVPMSGLWVHQLFNLIFVNRCGFDSVETNLPNWRITRADFQAGASYMATIGGIIGMFSPFFRVVGNTLWITDATAGIPSGFPAPRQIKLSDSAQLEIASEIERLDAVLLTYSTDRANYDFTATRTETETTEDVSNPNVKQTSTINRTIKEYFRSENPFTPIDQDLVSVEEQQFVQTPGFGSTLLYEAVENYTYDPTGNPKKRIRTENRLLPDIRIEEQPEVMLETKIVTEEWKYKPNPFRPGSKYQSSHSTVEQALLVVDDANTRLGQPYKEGYVEAFQAGNIAESMSVETSPIRTFVEKTKPLRDGRCKVERTEVDVLNRIVNSSESQTSVGEISISGLVKEQRQIYVLKDDISTRSTEKVIDLNGGEVPLNTLIPLARRILEQRQNRNASLTDTLAVFDLSVEKGSYINARGRNDEDLGNFVIEGRTMTGNRNLFTLQVQARRV